MLRRICACCLVQMIVLVRACRLVQVKVVVRACRRVQVKVVVRALVQLRFRRSPLLLPKHLLGVFLIPFFVVWQLLLSSTILWTRWSAPDCVVPQPPVKGNMIDHGQSIA